MAIDKNSLSMINPKSDGNNFGISNNWTQKDSGNHATNVAEVMASIGSSKNIATALSKVTSSNASGQEWVDNAVKNGGVNLGKPIGMGGRGE